MLYLLEQYGDLPLFVAMLEAAKGLLPKNIYYTVKKLATAYKSAFSKQRSGQQTGFPRTKKLRDSLDQMDLPVDSERFSFKQEGSLGINLGGGMHYFSINTETLTKFVGDLANIKSLEILCKHGDVYFSFRYKKEITLPDTADLPPKSAGMDLGVNNIASIFIDDPSTPSIVFKSDQMIEANSIFNKRLSSLRSQNDLAKAQAEKEKNELVSSLDKAEASDAKEAVYYSEETLRYLSPEYDAKISEYKNISGEISRLFAKRGHWFKDNLKKLARRLLEILQENEVTTLYTSRNLGKIIPNMGKVNNQKFVSLPIMKFLDYIKLNAAEYGIELVDDLDEAYTSRSSCFSDESNLFLAQKLGKEKRALMATKKGERTDKDEHKLQEIGRKLISACGGRRISRSCYRGGARNGAGKIWLADLGAALNHIRLGHGPAYDTSWVRARMFKLCRPRVIQCEGSFLDFGLAAFS
jgi:transposase